MQKSIADKIIISIILVLGLAEVAHLAALFLHLSFSMCAVVFTVLLLGLALFGIVKFVLEHRKVKNVKGSIAEKTGTPAKTLLYLYPFWILLTGGLIVFQIIWNYWMHIPYISNDITAETVQTMLCSDSIYNINPLTGQAFTAGMPMRLKILVLPTLCAVFCKWTGLSVITVCYSIIPMIILLLSYLVYSRWAVYLFPNEGRKQVLFMFFVAVIYQFGCYSSVMDSFLLFFRGGHGETLRTCVLLPYALLCCLQKDWKKAVLCVLAEACVVWTFYGLGWTALTIGVVCGISLIKTMIDRRKKV
ncbi:MAG: hypothetical protein IJ405_09325 [Lachnospiraceae bacterium]|nr:hypothetical protein [Lachnospiraceae bacterium]